MIIIELAYSFHLGSDKNKRNTSRSSAKSNKSGSTSLSNNAIQNSAGLTKVDKHNYRKYDNNQNDIEIIKGSSSLVDDVKKLYKEEFDETLERQKRQDTLITNLNKEKANLEKKLNESKLYFKNLYMDKMKGVISEEDFSMLREEYTKDVESYQTRLKDIEKGLDNTKERKENSKDIESILKKYKKINKLTRIIVDEFIEKIYIGTLDKDTKTREIKIEWNLDL